MFSSFQPGQAVSSSDEDDDDESEVGSLDQEDPEDTDLLTLEDIENASEEEESDRYTSNSCKESLAKVSKSPSLFSLGSNYN